MLIFSTLVLRAPIVQKRRSPRRTCPTYGRLSLDPPLRFSRPRVSASRRTASTTPRSPRSPGSSSWTSRSATGRTSIGFSYDHSETALGDGPRTWPSLADDTIAVLRNQTARPDGLPADLTRGSATALATPSGSLSAVITDPPYDNMIDYSDASDLFYVWLKRALVTTAPWFAFTAHPDGVQEKSLEAIVKRGGTANADHRTREHYADLW